MELKAKFPPHANVYWIEEINAVRVEWDKIFSSLDQFIEICDFVIAELQKQKGNVWIVDTFSGNGVFSKEVQEYIQNTLVSRAINSNINHVLTIVPQKIGLSSLSNKHWQKPVSNAGFVTGDFPDYDSCKKWLSEKGN